MGNRFLVDVVSLSRGLLLLFAAAQAEQGEQRSALVQGRGDAVALGAAGFGSGWSGGVRRRGGGRCW